MRGHLDGLDDLRSPLLGCLHREKRSRTAVPGSSEPKLRKAFASGVDSLCFDLEDSVAVDRKVGARETVLL